MVRHLGNHRQGLAPLRPRPPAHLPAGRPPHGAGRHFLGSAKARLFSFRQTQLRPFPFARGSWTHTSFKWTDNASKDGNRAKFREKIRKSDRGQGRGRRRFEAFGDRLATTKERGEEGRHCVGEEPRQVAAWERHHRRIPGGFHFAIFFKPSGCLSAFRDFRHTPNF